MKEKQATLFVLSVAVALTVVLGECSPAPIPSEVMSVTPEKVVESFYNWYVGYPGNLLVDGAYRSSEYLTEEFIQKVDGIIVSFDKGGYDPFLCTQDIPGEFTVEKAVMLGREASVWVVHEIWNFDTRYELIDDLEVRLRLLDGQWKIADVICLVPEPVVVVPAEGCPNATTGTQLLTNEQHGYCLLYPTGYDVQHPNEHETVLFVGSLLNVEQPRAYIKVQEAGGRTTAQVADELTAAFAGFDIKRTNVTIGGEAAVVLDNMPGQDTNRQVVIAYDDCLYMLTFVPASEDYGELYTQMETLYTVIINSFNFSVPQSVTLGAGNDGFAAGPRPANLQWS